MKRLLTLSLLAAALCGCGAGADRRPNRLRPSAYPLITIDPYTSGWSIADNLYDDVVRHWTGDEFQLLGVAKVDGRPYRFMGKERPQFDIVAPEADQAPWQGRYTRTAPPEGWMLPDFDDRAWRRDEGAFGSEHEATARTRWSGDEIWVRREVELTAGQLERTLWLVYSNDDDAEIYVNGLPVVAERDCHHHERVALAGDLAAALRPGRNVVAAHCLDRGGAALLDFGLLAQRPVETFFDETALQRSVDVQATQTRYVFACGPVDLTVDFIAPLLPDQLELLSRPVNYITYEATSNDGRPHAVELYFEASSAWATHGPMEVTSGGVDISGLCVLSTGSVDQPVLERAGDHVTIDWGHFLLAAPDDGVACRIGEGETIRRAFLDGAPGTSLASRRHTTQQMALSHDLGTAKSASGHILVGYDDGYSIQYFGENLRPWWNRRGMRTSLDLLLDAERQFAELRERCDAFDRQLMREAEEVGGRAYAELCATAYRQAVTAHKLVEAPDGELRFFSKENFSNGSIGTVDITYPSAPMFLYYNPELVKGMMNAIFDYSESGRWTKPFPAHDVGTYPRANGQTYGGDMPVEEAGNMLILTAAVAAVEGNADYASRHWETLTEWTGYLVEKGLDPENQLCTDDFAGHFAHNANLSIKAILGIASYGYLAAMRGDARTAARYTDTARRLAERWVEMADDGDHYRLTFDRPGSWSQKYNLVWDKIFGWGIFPDEVRARETAFYPSVQNRYGLPLDNREAYTKTDWIVWTATLCDRREAFEAMVVPVWDFMNETPDRVPMSDWVWTDRPEQRGFQARSVVGGYWIKLLEKKLRDGRSQPQE